MIVLFLISNYSDQYKVVTASLNLYFCYSR